MFFQNKSKGARYLRPHYKKIVKIPPKMAIEGRRYLTPFDVCGKIYRKRQEKGMERSVPNEKQER